MLGDPAGLAGGHLRRPDPVQQARLAVIHVPEHGGDHRASFEALPLPLVELLADLFLQGRPSFHHQFRFEFQGNQFGHVAGDRLIRRSHDIVLHQLANNVGYLDRQCSRQVLYENWLAHRGFRWAGGRGGFSLGLGGNTAGRPQTQALSAGRTEPGLSLLDIPLPPVLSHPGGLVAPGFLLFLSATVRAVLVLGLRAFDAASRLILAARHQRLGHRRIIPGPGSRPRTIQRLRGLHANDLGAGQLGRLRFFQHRPGRHNDNLRFLGRLYFRDRRNLLNLLNSLRLLDLLGLLRLFRLLCLFRLLDLLGRLHLLRHRGQAHIFGHYSAGGRFLRNFHGFCLLWLFLKYGFLVLHHGLRHDLVRLQHGDFRLVAHRISRALNRFPVPGLSLDSDLGQIHLLRCLHGRDVLSLTEPFPNGGRQPCRDGGHVVLYVQSLHLALLHNRGALHAKLTSQNVNSCSSQKTSRDYSRFSSRCVASEDLACSVNCFSACF